MCVCGPGDSHDKVPIEEVWYCMRKSRLAEKYVRTVLDNYDDSGEVRGRSDGGFRGEGRTAPTIGFEPLFVCKR